jgi:hypothetical protein
MALFKNFKYHYANPMYYMRLIHGIIMYILFRMFPENVAKMILNNINKIKKIFLRRIK